MTIENSPRATSSVPARTRPRTPTPARRAAHQPVASLVAAVTQASAAAGSRAGGSWAGSVCKPKNTKNTAANRSRSGPSSARAPCAAGPDRAIPARNAPTAADACSACASPATRKARPSTLSSRTSSRGLNTSRLAAGPKRSASSSTTPTAPTAPAIGSSPPTRLSPASRTVRTGRYTAMARSSITSSDRTTGVSRLPMRPRSSRSLATIPEEEIQVTPPSTSAASGRQPSSSPAASPGVKFSTRSIVPAGAPARSPAASSSAEYSSPRTSSSSTTPISAPAAANSCAADSGSRPPSPNASPASRYSGIGDSPKRPAIRPRTPSANSLPPSSRSRTAVWSSTSAAQDPHERADALGGADHHGGVGGLEAELRSRRGDRRAPAQHRHDRDAGAGAGARVADGPGREGGPGRDRQPVDRQPLHLLPEPAEPLRDAAGAEQLGEGVAVLVAQLDHVLAGVGVLGVEEQQVAAAGEMGHDPELAAGRGGELVAQPDAGQGGLLDVHGGSWVGAAAPGVPRSTPGSPDPRHAR